MKELNYKEEHILKQGIKNLLMCAEGPSRLTDILRPGLTETPNRVLAAWTEWTSGYNQDPKAVLKVFEDGAEDCNEMVTMKGIPFYSQCEHHLASIFGDVTISYIPNGKILGLSKFVRLVDIFAKRLQVQERLTNQIANAMQEHLEPLGVGVSITARHLCMESRGIYARGTQTVTTALRGVIATGDPRAEFLAQLK